MRKIIPVLLFIINVGLVFSHNADVKVNKESETPAGFSFTGGAGFPLGSYGNGKTSLNLGIDYITGESLAMIGIRYYGIQRQSSYSNSSVTTDVLEIHYRLPFRWFTLALGPIYTSEQSNGSSSSELGFSGTLGAMVQLHEKLYVDFGVSSFKLYAFVNVRFCF